METGRVGFKVRDVEDLLTLYGITGGRERSEVLALASRSGTPDWRARYGDILPGWFETCLGLESAAAGIRSFEVQFVPGLFQTGDYARAVARLGRQAARADVVERRMRLRVQRQGLLTRPGAPRVRAVMDEAVLRRPFGGAFPVLRFAGPDLPDVVYIEQLTSAVYLDQRPDVEHYLVVADHLSGEALTPADTTAFIEQVATET